LNCNYTCDKIVGKDNCDLALECISDMLDDTKCLAIKA